MIYQSGYLTIKGFERDDSTYLLDFPNNEVKRGFLTMVSFLFRDGNNQWFLSGVGEFITCLSTPQAYELVQSVDAIAHIHRMLSHVVRV